MKQKTIVFALFTALATFTTQAQIGDYRNDMCLGVSVGASMNKMGFDPIITQKFPFWNFLPSFLIPTIFP